MKNRLHVFALGLMLFSCGENFLDEQPKTAVLAKDFIADADNIRSIMAGAYQPMRWEYYGSDAFYDFYCMPYLYTDVRSDDVVIENRLNGEQFHDFENFSLKTSDVNVHLIWLKFFTGVATSNEIIQGLVQVNEGLLGEGEKELLLAEARFLRAFYYFELVKNFGDVPLFGDIPADIADPNQIKRKPVSEVYLQIESDLLIASEHLPLVQDELYKATKGAAMGLLSKVYLYQEKWQLAADMAQAVINLNHYALEEEYGDNWDITNEHGKESLFEITYFNERVPDPFSPLSRTSLTLQFFGPPFPEDHTGWVYNLITPELLQAFNDAGDVERRDATIMQEGHEFDSPLLAAQTILINTPKPANPIPEGWFDITLNSAASNGQQFGNEFYYSLKYFLTPEEVDLHCPDFRYSSLNHKVLRYAEILLILAESVANGATGDGQGALDLVRERAGLDPVPLTLDAIKLERRLELATEWNRFHDLVRWGDAAEEIDGFTVGRDELLPIPVDEIILVGTLPDGDFILTQNTGY
ncbi:MAG: RagB/SusD family nutrient uptake outer membrane protein [Cyclobacteriaceae bacterium]